MSRTMSALFPQRSQAEEFCQLLQTDPAAWHVHPATLTIEKTGSGTEVVWRTDGQEGDQVEYVRGMRQTVGYFGSSQSARAVLNGRSCPASF